MLIALLAVVLSWWVAQLVLVLRVLRNVPRVASLDPPALTRWPKLSMIVPARDEAEGIEGALRSKLSCGYPALELVAVNDRSRDDTGAIIERIAATDPRIAAAHVQQLPDGWLGKLNALSKGLERATGEWVLLSDADVHVEPGTLEKLIAHAEHEQLDLIAVFPRMHRVSLAVDATVAVLMRVIGLSGRIWAANDDRSSIGVGVGAFNLVRKQVLDQTDAISRLRMEVADDIGLGAVLKQSGARTRIYAGGESVHLVFHSSLKAALRSMEKGGHALGFSFLIPLVVGLLPMLLDVVLPSMGFAAGGVAATLAAVALATGLLTHVLLVGHFDGPLRGVLLWPVGTLINSVMMFIAGWGAWWRQGIVWRDTFYPRAALEQGRVLMLPALKVRA
jgi:GT2 family glycosyltransferase